MVDRFDAKFLQRIRHIGFVGSFPWRYELTPHQFKKGKVYEYDFFVTPRLKALDVPCWYNLRNLNRIDFFFEWNAAREKRRRLLAGRKTEAQSLGTLEYLCLEIEYTARSIATHLLQDFKGCREKLAEGMALCCHNSRPIGNWGLYLEPKITQLANKILNEETDTKSSECATYT